MLDSKIKKKFDSARQILVGKIPSPSAQIEQITFAMIIKFIEDMKIHQLPYSWTNFISLENDSTTLVENYQETLTYLSNTKDLPIFFSLIFKNAKLNFESGEILRKFLFKINEFDYFKDSEILGEGYEYLLQQYGKQGALGQFRTPKHILDFMVAVIEPTEKDKIHDPACGTGGFLVSALNYVYLKNIGIKPGDKLRPDEKNYFLKNLLGFDVSPDMTRLALVNLWLQGVGNPNIQEYDTISNPSRWSEYYDVILTNPPFMTPKEGMVVHGKFKNKSMRKYRRFSD
jgi:type I restriction enzyme M protein